MAYSKYKNKKCEVDGIKFDSQVESKYYIYLKGIKEQGLIKDFSMQPKYELQEAFRDKNNKLIRKIEYKGDFLLTLNDDSQVVIDVKGSDFMLAPEFKLKRKLFMYKYPDIPFTCVMWKKKEWVYF